MPSYLGHVLIENRNGLVVGACATQASATAEWEAALAMELRLGERNWRGEWITLGGNRTAFWT